MKAWWGNSPARSGASRCASANAPIRARVPGKSWSRCARAGCAAPTCTWPRATCAPHRAGVCPATRSSARSSHSARARAGFARRATGSASPGCAAPAARAGSAAAATRTSASPHASPAGTPTAATPSYATVRERLRLPAAGRASTTSRPRRCCAPGSSATGRCAGPTCRPAGGSASTGSARSAHLAAQVAHRRRARRCTCSPARRRPRSWRSSSAPPPRGDATTRRPSRSTPRSSSPRPATWCPSRCAALDRGGTLAVAGIHLTDIPALRLPRHLFRERQLRSVTANTRADGEDFLELAARILLRPTTPCPTRWPRPTGRWPTWPATASPGAAVLEVGGLGEPVAAAPVPVLQRADPAGPGVLAARRSATTSAKAPFMRRSKP